MRTATLALSNAGCLPGNVSNSATAYNAQFDALRGAVIAYVNNPGNRKQELEDIITFDFINQLRGNLTYDPPIIDVPIAGTAPVGYNNYMDLFTINNFKNTIIGYADNYYFDGCIITPLGTTPKLQADIATVGAAEAAESVKRVALTSYYREFSQGNTFKFLVENISTSGVTTSKINAGLNIYVDKGAKYLIDTMSLDIYIPIYIP